VTPSDMVSVLRSYAQEHGCMFDQAADLMAELATERDGQAAQLAGLTECRSARRQRRLCPTNRARSRSFGLQSHPAGVRLLIPCHKRPQRSFVVGQSRQRRNRSTTRRCTPAAP